ncbi:unnamed protein product [Cylindrotheca closterium]|uniref:Uncharacterized protein n=1 Tax=Cylindrotheca closterium TaxID=2856 RepID=A0AAD2JHV0_9STRA|nr:unnamed protein product [Cylindrotheca closterium]
MGRDGHKHRSRRDDKHKSKRKEDDDEKRHGRRSKHGREDDGSSSRKRHDKKRKHRRDDDSEEERRRRRKRKHRHGDYSSSEDDDRKRRKHDSRRNDKKISSRSDDKRKLKDKKEKKDKKDKKRESKRPDKSKMQSLGPALGRKPDKLIDPVEDYYSYHEHFWVYLYREEGVAFNDMTSEESKEAFERFAKEYNSGNLELEYYGDRLPTEVIEATKTTKHSWSFSNVLSDREKKGLQTVQQGIRQQTEYNSKGPEPKAPPGGAAMCKPTAAPKPTTTVEPPTFSRKTPEEIQEERSANKRLRNHVRTVEEELQGGPKDFRERQLEKKRQQGDRIHGASRAREDAGIELSDSALYGGDDNANRFEGALAREKARKAKRADDRANRIQELQAKEQERQENMLEMLGLKNLKPGQKITIAPRKDG